MYCVVVFAWKMQMEYNESKLGGKKKKAFELFGLLTVVDFELMFIDGNLNPKSTIARIQICLCCLLKLQATTKTHNMAQESCDDSIHAAKTCNL